MPSMLLRAAIVPRKTIRGNRVFEQIASHIVTPCIIAACRSKTNARLDLYSGRLHTHVQYSSALKLKRDSSMKITHF